MFSHLNIYVDGGARGNPGPSATGVYITDQDGRKIAGFGRKIGRATNNIAEYKAVISALEWIIENKNNLAEDVKIYLFLDSNLAYSQISGLFRIKNTALKNLYYQVKEKEAEIKFPIYYNHIPREKNTQADKLVNLALDTID
ncbi:MAG: ribonuclease HI family protein [Candidatus Levybacteria bacterium]|nr:ribonuclease HI family protein [Candidatus Levybacteria bacterium]